MFPSLGIPQGRLHDEDAACTKKKEYRSDASTLYYLDFGVNSRPYFILLVAFIKSKILIEFCSQ